jgi:hypothetical protein
MAKKKPEDHLPKRGAAKKSGKKTMVGPPLDPEADFETPVKKGETTDAAAPKEKGTSLLVEQPKKPKVVGRRFEAFFLKPAFTKTAKGDLMVGFRMTVPIEAEHETVLPKLIWDGYKDVRKKARLGTKFKDLPAQHVLFYLSDKDPDAKCELPVAQLLQAHVDVVQRKGEGESRKVFRLSFMLQSKQSREIAHFADFNHGNNFWIELENVTIDMFEDDEEKD